MRTAILFTGQERQFARVSQLIKSNLLEPNNVVVFLACETSNPSRLRDLFAGYEIGGHLLLPTFRTQEFAGLMSVMEGRPGLSEKVFDRSQKHDGVAWSMGYLRTSGTILQYYQVWKAWLMMVDYERKHGVRFDICVRARLDMILTERLDLVSFFSTIPESETERRCLGNSRIRKFASRETNQYEHPHGTPLSDRTVWTLGQEQIWIMKRDLFDLFGQMVLSYGMWDSGLPIAFCSEAFFQEFCLANSIVHYAVYESGNPLFNCSHPGADPVETDPYVFSLLR